MLQFNIPEEQYVLSLDSLDLNFLSQYIVKPSEEKRPLWSMPNEESAYYQVKIESEEPSEEDAFIEPYKSYLCYICNVYVPEKYYKQHNNSERHQNHKMLAAQFLENVAKQISIDINISNNEEDDNFYCEICCKVVSVKNKRKHKKSNYHLKSIESGQLTTKFLKMYGSSKSPESDSESENNSENEVDSECSSMLDSDCSVTYDREHEYTEYDVIRMATLATDSMYNTMNGSEYTENDVIRMATLATDSMNNTINGSDNESSEVTHFRLYLEEMIHKLQYKMPIFEDNSIVIVTPKGYREHIMLDNFNSYVLRRNSIYCILCKKWIDHTIEHYQSEQHFRNIMRPVNDNFERKLDALYSHCLLCNMEILTGSNHAEDSLLHKKYISNKSTPSNSTDQENMEVVSEVPTTSTERYLSDEEPDEVNAEQKLSEYIKHFAYLDTVQLKCQVCSVAVPRSNSNIITHVEGNIHTNTCNVLLKNNNLKKLSFKLYYCNVCDDNTENFIEHINSHKSKLESAKRKVDKNKVIKYIYDDPLNDDPIAMKYRQKYEDDLEINQIEIIKAKSTFYCNVCSVRMSRISEIDHMYGERHRLAMLCEYGR